METNLKFNSQVCTTKIQSERLLALGLNSDTADMGLIGDIPIVLPTTWANADPLFDTPAWSLHRLIEIADIMAFSPVSSIDGWYDDIIAQIQSLIHIGYIDKKYLNMDIVNAKENENMELLKNKEK